MEYMTFGKGVFITLFSFLLCVHLILTVLPPRAALIESRPECHNPQQRKEWSAATDEERKSYIDAVICLATKPSRIGLVNSTLYDDFAYLHKYLEPDIHGTALFLPWHRYLLRIYEATLHSCGYNGLIMYWDWVADSAAPSKAEVWSPVDGFGGNGTSTNPSDPDSYCVRDGPFTNLRPYYKHDGVHPHCIERQFMNGHPEVDLPEMLGDAYSSTVIDTILAHENYAIFNGDLGGGPHESVHAGIAGGMNGDMGLLTAPNDPIFFLHHAQLDRIWWIWQQASPSTRKLEYGGSRANGTAAEVTDIMIMKGLAPDRMVGDFLSTETIDLCYKY